MNPWKIIGWIVLALMLLSLTFCGLVCVRVASNTSAPQTGTPGPGNPAGIARLYKRSISCDPHYGLPRADVVFENDGGVDLEFAKAYVSFGGKIREGYIRPTTLPRGSLGTVTIYGVEGGSADCRLERVQDRSGNRIQVLNSGN